MEVNRSIVGVLNPLWQVVENYLNCSSSVYRVKIINRNTIYLQSTEIKQNYLITALKIFSYATLVLPAAAWLIRTFYRSKYEFKSYNLAEGLQRVKADYEIEIDKQVAKEIEKNIYKQLVQQNSEVESLTLAEVESTLEGYLCDLATYEQSQEQVAQLCYTVLDQLLRNPDSESSFLIGKMLYKKMATFLRKETKSKEFANYERMQETSFFGAKFLLIKLSSRNNYVNPAHITTMTLLKYLRKRLKLIGKNEKVWKKIQAMDIPDVSEELKKRAFQYLTLTWAHGTKASVISAAFANTNGELWPSGKLRQRKMEILTGEMSIGATVLGINVASLSGVKLKNAETSIHYAHAYTYDLKIEEQVLDTFLGLLFEAEVTGSLRDLQVQLSRIAIALQRIQSDKPEKITQNRQNIKDKMKEIYQWIEFQIIDTKRLILWQQDGSDYEIANFYSLLKSLEQIDDFLTNPVIIQQKINRDLAKIPVVLASQHTYGVPCDLFFGAEHGEDHVMRNMAIGQDLQLAFTPEEHIKTVQSLIDRHHISDKVIVEPMQVLEVAVKMEKLLEPYFYDVYNVKKWKAIIAAAH